MLSPMRRSTCGERPASPLEPSYAEISAALGMPVGAIGPTRQRCLAKLQSALEAGAS